MITYEEVIALGWIDRHGDGKPEPNNTFRIEEEHGRHIMMIWFKPDEDGLHTCMLKWADEDVKVNEWENSDPAFYGLIKTVEDLKNIMRYCGVIEY